MTIYILYHNTRNNSVPQWNYIPTPDLARSCDDVDDQFDLTLVESMPNTDIAYAKIEAVPQGSKWLYAINNLYSNDVYTQNGLDVLDHFCSDERLMSDLLSGHGRILFDDRREGYLYDNYIGGQISQFFSNRNIPLDKVVFATGTANAEQIFNYRNYEIKPFYVRQFELEASKLCDTVPYQSNRLPVKRFLCFNRRYAYRLHRLQFLSLIYQHNLLPLFYYSMLDGVDHVSVVDAAKSLIGNEPQHFKTYETMLKLHDKMPMSIDTDDLQTNLATTHYLPTVQDFYNQSAISVVVETLFYDSEIFLSEKIWHPIRMSQPFILVGGAGSLQHLRDLGYKTFDHWWDESYDNIADPYDRMMSIVSIIKQISNWSEFQLSLFLIESAEICKHNFNHLMSAKHRISYDSQITQLFL